MFLILLALFFVWLSVREIVRPYRPRKGYAMPDSSPVSIPYVALTLLLAIALAWKPLSIWRFEKRMAKIATVLADGRPATFHCNTLTDAMFDNDPFAAGHASPQTGHIVFQIPWCDTLRDYLAHPDRASPQELHSLNMLTHESMHVRGEMNEAKTECQAIQRNFITAKLLGVPENIARANAADYYRKNYQQLKNAPERVASYYSDFCAPDADWDEHLADSTWARQ